MAKLTEEQAKQLAELEAVRDAPDDDDAGGRAEFINVTIDLSDEEAVKRGLALGFLKPGDVGDDEGDGDGDEDKPPPKDKVPRRSAYFKTKESEQ